MLRSPHLVSAAVIVGTVLAPTVAAHAADWSDWQPVPDRYQNAVDLRFRPSKKQNEDGLEYQFRNRYGQKVTLNFALVGVDNKGREQTVDQIVVLEPGEQKIKGDAPRVPFARLNGFSLHDIKFAGTPPTPTVANADPVSVALITKALAETRDNQRKADAAQTQAERDLSALRARAGANKAISSNRSDNGTLDQAGPGDINAAEDRARRATEAANDSRKRVTALEKALKTAQTTKPGETVSAAPPAAAKPAMTKERQQEIKSLFADAQASFQAGSWAKASTALKALVESPDLPIQGTDRGRLYANLGVALENQEKHAAAEAALREAVLLDPANASAFNDLATTQLPQHKTADAEASLRQAVSLDAKNANYQDNLGIVLMAEGKFKEAETAFREATKLDPSSAHYKEQLKNAQAAAKK